MRKATVFKTTLLLFLLAQAMPAAFAQQDESTTRTIPYRIGVFPFEALGGGPWNLGEHKEVIDLAVDAVQTFVDGHPMFVRTYSFYDGVLNAPRLRKPEKLWADSPTEKKPVVSLVSTAGRERNVDGVLMGWLKLPPGYGFNITSLPVEIYLIDVASHKVYRAKGTNTTKLVDKVLAAFVEGRGEKLDVALLPAEQAPAQVEEKTRSTPYRIGVFPSAAYSPYGDSYSELALELTADALQTFVDGHPSLVLAYSYFDRMLNEPRLRKVHKLWAGPLTKKKPVVSLVSTAGRERSVDGVLMCWLRIPPRVALVCW